MVTATPVRVTTPGVVKCLTDDSRVVRVLAEAGGVAKVVAGGGGVGRLVEEAEGGAVAIDV